MFFYGLPVVTGFICYVLQVDMDMEDDIGDALPVVQGREDAKVVDSPVRDGASDGTV